MSSKKHQKGKRKKEKQHVILMTNELASYYSRILPLPFMTLEKLKIVQERLATIIGVGGLGTVSTEQLLSLGVGKLRLVDRDIIENHNLPRQKLFFIKDVGDAKVEVAKKFLTKRNPFAKIETLTESFDYSNSERILHGSDIIVDGLDNFQTRKVLNKTAYQLNIPWVFGGALGTSGNVMTITFRENTPCFNCFFDQIVDEGLPTCETAGVSSSILALVASIQVNEAIRILIEERPLLEGKLLFVDLDDYQMEIINIEQRDDCSVCSENAELMVEEVSDEYSSECCGKLTVVTLCERERFIVKPEKKPDVNFDKAQSFLERKFSGKKFGSYGYEFKYKDAEVFLMRTFVMSIKNSKSPENAVVLFKKVVELLQNA